MVMLMRYIGYQPSLISTRPVTRFDPRPREGGDLERQRSHRPARVSIHAPVKEATSVGGSTGRFFGRRERAIARNELSDRRRSDLVGRIDDLLAQEIKVADVAELIDARDLKSPGAAETTHFSDLTRAGNPHEAGGDPAVLSNTPPLGISQHRRLRPHVSLPSSPQKSALPTGPTARKS